MIITDVSLVDIVTDESLHEDIWNLSKHYSMKEILNQYEEIGIYLSEIEYKKLKYK